MKKGLLIAVSGLLTAAVLMGCAKLGGYAAQPDNAPAYQQRNNAVACENDTNDCKRMHPLSSAAAQNTPPQTAEPFSAAYTVLSCTESRPPYMRSPEMTVL